MKRLPTSCSLAQASIRLLPVLFLALLCALCTQLTPALAAGTPPTITPIANQLMQMGSSTAALAFTVSDKVTLAASLTVTCASSNTALVPTTGIVLVAPNTQGVCSVTLTPKSVYSGLTTITLTVKNGAGLTAKTSFTLTVNHPPTITKLANQSLFAGTPSTALPFTVGDDCTPLASLTLSGVSSNTTLIPSANLVFGGSGAARTVTVTPVFGKTGIATMTLTVTDGNGGATSTSFVYTVKITPPPTISSISNQLINMGTSASALAFTVGDTYTPLSSLLVTCTSSNTALVHAAAIVLTGPDAQGHCAVSLTPVNVYSGISTITLMVKNAAGLTTKTTFILTVNAKPTISKIANLSINENTSSSALAFTVGDDLTAVGALTVAGSSSNITLVPSANIVFGGSGTSRTVTITPVIGMNGTATITLSVTDGGGLSATTSFTVTVMALPGTPGTNSTDGATMVWVPGGSFTMGSIAGAGYSEEQPAHTVTLTGYWIYENPVTVAQYRAFCAATGYALPTYPSAANAYGSYTPWSQNVYWTGTAGNLQQTPIVNVDWYDCKAYADWAGVKLPTEAQYEYASRGPRGNNYPWGGTATAADWYNGWDDTKCANYDNSYAVGKSTWPVGSFPAGASWCGAQDMTGNVWEWCADWYGNYGATPVTNPTGPATGDARVLRGGSWYGYYYYYGRGAFRNDYYPSGSWYDVGFRCISVSPGP